MPLITLRIKSGTSSPGDLIVEIKDNTFEYLSTSTAEKIRVSAYLDRDWPMISENYAEILLKDAQSETFEIKHLTPGSRTRKNITLPGPMQKGEQLTLEVLRSNIHAEN